MADTDQERCAIGRTSATEREPTTADAYSFWLADDVIVNPFDIVAAPQVDGEGGVATETFGLVTKIEHRTDAPSHLANFISSNFGEVSEEPNTPRVSVTIATANVLTNTGQIYMPVPSDRDVQFASASGMETALGVDQMSEQDRIPAGLVAVSNGTQAVASLDRRYVLGPEGAHVNISGISGLATKTSYAMFLIQSILQTAPNANDIAVIIMNVKQGDLLRLDCRGPIPTEDAAIWQTLGLRPTPFANVRYLVPRGANGGANCFLDMIGRPHNVYAYDLPAAIDKLDLLFSQVSDPSNTMESIIGDVSQSLEVGVGEWGRVGSWDALLGASPLCDSSGKSRALGDNRASSVGKFRRQLRRLVRTRQTGIFPEALAGSEVRLADVVADLQGGATYVVDIAKLRDEEQTLVFGDLLRTLYALKSGGMDDVRQVDAPIPSRVIFFVDELNKYAPAAHRESSISGQVLEIAERGRGLGVILISAQQFMSSVQGRITGNAATKVLGRSGALEVAQEEYRFLPNEVKSSLTRLEKGELLLNHAVYRQPVKIVFPRPAYEQPQ